MPLSPEIRDKIAKALQTGLQPLEIARRLGLSLLSVAETILDLRSNFHPFIEANAPNRAKRDH